MTPESAAAILIKVCQANGLEPKRFGPGVVEVLAATQWNHGRPDELTVIADLAQRIPGHEIGLVDVLAELRITARTPLDEGRPDVVKGETLRTARRRFERAYVEAVLVQHNYNVRSAAVALGIQRTNLYRKLRALRLRGPFVEEGA